VKVIAYLYFLIKKFIGGDLGKYIDKEGSVSE
jgi:hypothetical protein